MWKRSSTASSVPTRSSQTRISNGTADRTPVCRRPNKTPPLVIHQILLHLRRAPVPMWHLPEGVHPAVESTSPHQNSREETHRLWVQHLPSGARLGGGPKYAPENAPVSAVWAVQRNETLESVLVVGHIIPSRRNLCYTPVLAVLCIIPIYTPVLLNIWNMYQCDCVSKINVVEWM